MTAPALQRRLSVERIENAFGVIDPVFLNTPHFRPRHLGKVAGLDLALKVETLNPIRSFKGRGAELFAAALGKGAELVCASSGNFGQGLAWACRRRRMRLTVFTSEHANTMKLERMRELEANVVTVGTDFDTAKLAGLEFADNSGALFVEDGREVAISEGAGTIAVELEALERLDAVVLPIGNGALVNGVGTWMRARRPDVAVYGVCAEEAPCMALSWRRGEVISTDSAATIADGVAIRLPVPEALADMHGLVDDIVLVSEEEIKQADRALLLDAGVVAEPSGAVGFAGVRKLAAVLQERTVATVVTGGNLTEEQARDMLR